MSNKVRTNENVQEGGNQILADGNLHTFHFAYKNDGGGCKIWVDGEEWPQDNTDGGTTTYANWGVKNSTPQAIFPSTISSNDYTYQWNVGGDFNNANNPYNTEITNIKIIPEYQEL